MIRPGLYTHDMRALFVLLFVLASAPSVGVAGETVTFTRTALKGNQTLTSTESLTMNFGIDIFVGEANLGSLRAENAQMETFTVELGKWTAKKRAATFSYGKNGSVEKQTTPDGKTEVKDEPSPVSGKAFKLTSKKGAEPTIVYAGGGEPSEEERAEVLEDWNDLIADEPSEFESAFVDQELEVGADLTTYGQVLATLLSLDDDELTVKDPKLVFKEVRVDAGERCAVFDVELTIVGDDAEMHMEMAAKGEAIVSIKGARLHSVAIAGPVTLAAAIEEDGVAMTMQGGGDFAFSLAQTYGR